jgi:hypothetical protein
MQLKGPFSIKTCGTTTDHRLMKTNININKIHNSKNMFLNRGMRAGCSIKSWNLTKNPNINFHNFSIAKVTKENTLTKFQNFQKCVQTLIFTHENFWVSIRRIIRNESITKLTRTISLKPLHNSNTTFLIWGTSVKRRRGRIHRRSMRAWAPDWDDTWCGIQHRNTRLTWKDNNVRNVFHK